VLARATEAAAQRDFKTALDLIHEPLESAHADTNLLLFGARTARRAGQPTLAERYLQRYQERGGDGELVAIERILGGIQQGEVAAFEGGIRFCDKNPTHPEVPFVLEALTEGYLKTGHLVGAVDVANRWMAANPPPADRAQALLWRGTCYRHVGNLDLALADFREALTLMPDSTDAHALAGEALTGRNPDEALTHFAAALEKDPNRVDVRLGLARCRRNRGETELARAELDSALASETDNLPALIERAKLLVDVKDYTNAERDLQRALVLAPRSLDALTTLARVLQLTNREAEAEKVRQTVKTVEAELFRKIEERVAAGLIPRPPQGVSLPGASGP